MADDNNDRDRYVPFLQDGYGPTPEDANRWVAVSLLIGFIVGVVFAVFLLV